MALKSRLSVTIALALAGALGLGPAWADPPQGKGKGNAQEERGGKGRGNNDHGGGKQGGKHADKGGGRQGGRGDAAGGDLIRAGITIATARGYAADYRAVGYDPLPPGIRKNLARGKPLPPGIAKKMVPSGMLARLPVYPGYEWRIAGTDLILVSLATLVVADVLADVFR
ncbi:hypothetical protein CDO44_10360 [Pigmentiphaga sp. NML080357]|uniref:anti-virulence regulator CigR family protein n=1 Tax=Pigmentiphaga sp. NML080357 TaxID=2008675 RepID=UPI000B40D6EA|nr:anti-virulence regulator CigR family protein [Pigmentiphaga sp. NML080357]OVZ60068.1 hypothetical protein CDO44_10360 [Pigmentiphaga sp. NML080357]